MGDASISYQRARTREQFLSSESKILYCIWLLFENEKSVLKSQGFRGVVSVIRVENFLINYPIRILSGSYDPKNIFRLQRFNLAGASRKKWRLGI